MIAILLDSSAAGGIETHVAVLADCIRRAGHSVQVLFLRDHGPHPLRRQLDARGVVHANLDGSIRDLCAALAAHPDGLLHTHGYKANIYGRIAAWRTRTPFVSTYHAGERGPFPVNLYQQLDTWLTSSSTRLCVSSQIQSRFVFKPRLVRNFLPAPATPHLAAQSPVLAPGELPATEVPRRIVFVGRASEEKAPDRFCQIAETLAARCPGRFSCHLFGAGPMLEEMRARYGQTVTFHGFVEDVSAVLASADLLLIPSRAEGLPMVALEALSHGVPIIATPVGDLPAVVVPGQTGALIDGDPVAGGVAQVLWWDGLAANEQRALRLNARAHLETHFSATRWLPEIFQAYAEAGWESGVAGSPRAATIAATR
ncbi:MAG: glycosyltransferase family 4 protein [Pseudomonadota bacterium]